MERPYGMWTRGIDLDERRIEAWWEALDGCFQEAVKCLDEVTGDSFQLSECDLTHVRVTDVANAFGLEEKPATAVYSMLTGDTHGLLMFTANMPAMTALEAARRVFNALAFGLGGIVDEAWALVDMRSALAETLAAQTGCLELKVMACIDFLANDGTEATVFFIPDWATWNTRWTLEASREAA